MSSRILGALLAMTASCWLVESGPDPCPGLHGPSMVRTGGYCIDSTEVSNDQYGAFFAEKGGDTSGQPAVCSDNISFQPTGGCWPFTDGRRPVACIDWCDARAYCEWAGKRLCGRLGGGPVDAGEIALSTIDEWTGACSGSTMRTFPYGDTFDPNACNVPESNTGGTDEVGTLVSCEVNGIFDLVGNVYEFEDSCSPSDGSADVCQLRGGAYIMSGAVGTDATCTFAVTQARGESRSSNVGFRCCADL